VKFCVFVLAIIVYNMLEKGQPYQPQQLEDYQKKVRIQKLSIAQKINYHFSWFFK